MSNITTIIPRQQFEFIRDRIFEILVDEINGQYILTSDSEFNILSFIERNTPIDKTECPAMVVSYAKSDFSNKHQGSTDNAIVFNIDFFTNSKSNIADGGDKLSALKLHKLLGVARYILEDPIYKTLGFTAPYIMKSYVSEINIAAGNKEDATNTSMGRLTFNVVCNETNVLKTPELIEGFNTQVKIDNSGKGYFYEGQTY